MDAAGTDLDDMLVCLMAMGFDIKDCQDAIQFGKVTVESAVNWIIGGKPGYSDLKNVSAQCAPSLKLRSTQSNFENNPNIPVNPVPVQSEIPEAAASASQSESTAQETDQSDTQVVSRMHLSDEQRKYKAGFEQKQREEAKKTAMLEKKRQREEHARILKEIAEDREKQRLTHPAPSKLPRANDHVTDSISVGGATDKVGDGVEKMDSKTAPAATSSRSSDTCLLQIRLPDGRSIRHSFKASSTLREVWNFTSSHCDTMAGFTFIQPFPHHEFTREEMLSSLDDLKLTPSGSLVLQRKKVTQAAGSSDMSAVELEEMDEKRKENAQGQGHVHDPDPKHKWGHGQAMDTNEPQDIPAQPALDEEEEDMVEEAGPGQMVIPGFPGGGGLPPGFQGIPGMPGMGHQIGGGLDMAGGMNMFGEMMGQGQAGVFGGVGQRLVPEGHPGHDDSHHQRSVREVALERAQARLAQPVNPPEQQDNIHRPSTSSVQTLPSLQLCCLRHVTQRLNDPRNQILSLSGVSEEMAQIILSHLLKEKQLKPKTLNAFLPCYLRRLVFDCYPYTTNELLHTVRLHTNLIQLSLHSCPTITDAGLQCLCTLKKLKSLNLSSCKQLSNKCVPVLTYLSTLVSLNLEDTGLSDPGVIEFLCSKPPSLQHLNLNRTAVTHAIIPHMNKVPGLKSLLLEDTKVVSLLGVKDLSQLETLNVARTSVVTESLMCLADHPSLTSVNIANTDNISGDQALKHLSGLKLQALTLPSRHTTTDLGMSFIKDLPLTTLDLTNFINIGDDGIEHIGKMNSIKKLLLGNTKVTDVGMLFLQGMTQLEILNLDRTSITNEGASVISAFTNLLELSLASTSVSSKFLLSGALNDCVNLTKLNLSRTSVTTKGVKSLCLRSLAFISLDGTRVVPDVREVLMEQCPSLTQVSLRNLAPVSRDDDLEDEIENMDT